MIPIQINWTYGVISLDSSALIKDIHNFAKEYLRDWFPNLVSYQTFNYRLNRMAGAVRELSSQLLRMFRPSDCQDDTVIVDSMPIITCCGRNRTGKVARDIADKGYCSTKNLYYHGLKLHMVGYRRKGHLPHPCQIALSPASENDLKVFQSECMPDLFNKKIFADKILTTGSRKDAIRPMSSTLPSSQSKGLMKKRSREARPLMTFILKPFHLSGNPLKRYSVGWTKKQIFKELQSAPLLADC